MGSPLPPLPPALVFRAWGAHSPGAWPLPSGICEPRAWGKRFCMWDTGLYMPKAFQCIQPDADQFMGERVNCTGASLEAKGLFSPRNRGLRRRKGREGGREPSTCQGPSYHLVAAFAITAAAPSPGSPRARDRSIAGAGRGWSTRGSAVLRSCDLTSRYLGSQRSWLCPARTYPKSFPASLDW